MIFTEQYAVYRLLFLSFGGSLFQSLAFKGSPPPASGPCLVQDADLTDVHQNGWFLDGIRGHSCNTPLEKPMDVQLDEAGIVIGVITNVSP